MASMHNECDLSAQCNGVDEEKNAFASHTTAHHVADSFGRDVSNIVIQCFSFQEREHTHDDDMHYGSVMHTLDGECTN